MLQGCFVNATFQNTTLPPLKMYQLCAFVYKALEIKQTIA